MDILHYMYRDAVSAQKPVYPNGIATKKKFKNLIKNNPVWVLASSIICLQRSLFRAVRLLLVFFLRVVRSSLIQSRHRILVPTGSDWKGIITISDYYEENHLLTRLELLMATYRRLLKQIEEIQLSFLVNVPITLLVVFVVFWCVL